MAQQAWMDQLDLTVTDEGSEIVSKPSMVPTIISGMLTSQILRKVADRGPSHLLPDCISEVPVGCCSGKTAGKARG